MKPVVTNGAVNWKYPDGSIILKAGYTGSAPPGTGETPSKLSVMMKRPGDPRARGGWLWVGRDMASGVESVIDAPYCVDCHGYANGSSPNVALGSHKTGHEILIFAGRNTVLLRNTNDLVTCSLGSVP